MEKVDREVIRKNLTGLIEMTDLSESLQTKLVETGIFTTAMVEEIMSEAAGGRKRKLYVKVQQRGPKAFDSLVTALADSGNTKAAQILNPGLESSKVWNPPNYQERLPTNYAPPQILTNNTAPLEVKVKVGQDLPKTSANNCYRMEAKPRGFVLIIDNENFQGEVLPTRTGSVVDANNLDILFGQLGFRVTLRRNLGYYDMIQEVQRFAGRSEHAAADMAVLAVLSHGRHGLVAAADGRELEVEWILRQLNNDGCPNLKGKPKLFIFQACRGDEADYGVVESLKLPEERTDSDARRVEPAEPITNRHQNDFKEVSWEDMLVAYATLPGYVANRDRYRGTWFVESLCSVFMDRAADTDLRDMLDVVAQRLKNYESEMGTKQTFAYEVRHFYKKLFFNPE